MISKLKGTADEFDLVRERLLVAYGHNTARAYWSDLEHWRDWCVAQDPAIDPVHATNHDTVRYEAALIAAGS
jgi:hypothetical protein